MPLPLSPKDIKRLSSLTGIPRRQKDSPSILPHKSIDEMLSNAISKAFERCLPFWLELGRINDFSYGIKTPSYTPHEATLLGREFIERFYKEYPFLISQLHVYETNTAEYLCICDLLHLVVDQYACIDYSLKSVPHLLLTLKNEVPEVIKTEYINSKFLFKEHINNLGEFFQVYVKVEYED